MLCADLHEHSLLDNELVPKSHVLSARMSNRENPAQLENKIKVGRVQRSGKDTIKYHT